MNSIDRWSLVLAAAVAIALALLPGHAQTAQQQPDASASLLFLPDLRNPLDWFTQPELEQAMQAAGYEPGLWAEHTVCTLDDSAAPPRIIRYATCDLLLDEETGGANYVTFWYSPELGRVAWLPDNATVVAATLGGL